MEEAVRWLQSLVASGPANSTLYVSLGDATRTMGDLGAAARHYGAALELDPDDVRAGSRLAWLLATAPHDQLRDGGRAVVLAERAAEAMGFASAEVLDVLAAAYAEVGRFEMAVRTAQKAVALSADGANDALRRRCDLYERGLPFRDSTMTRAGGSTGR